MGLGNPGAEYAETRHNVGEAFATSLASQYRENPRVESKFHGLFCTLRIKDHQCHVLVPTTYMNDSGIAVAAVAKFYKLPPAAILVVHDELDFDAGDVRLKAGGGHGGHNGLRDIECHLHTRDFYRLRIGIGHPGHKDKVTPFVLGRASSSDQKLIDRAIDDGLAVIEDLVAGDFDKATRFLSQA